MITAKPPALPSVQHGLSCVGILSSHLSHCGLDDGDEGARYLAFACPIFRQRRIRAAFARAEK